MRKTATFFVLLSIALSALSNNPNLSVLKINLHDQAIFNITINRKSYNHHSTSYAITNLKPGRHFVEIVRFEEIYNGQGYVPGRARVVFADYIRIPAGFTIAGYIDHRQRFVETSREKWRPSHTPNPAHHYQPGHGNPGHGQYNQGMSPAAFAYLIQTLEDEGFDSRRLSIARQAASSSSLTSFQVAEIMTTFSFESNRLAFAKYAYPYTIDPQNYFIVNKSFSFSGSTTSLNNYLSRHY